VMRVTFNSPNKTDCGACCTGETNEFTSRRCALS
jgi:hypothetical protein